MCDRCGGYRLLRWRRWWCDDGFLAHRRRLGRGRHLRERRDGLFHTRRRRRLFRDRRRRQFFNDRRRNRDRCRRRGRFRRLDQPWRGERWNGRLRGFRLLTCPGRFFGPALGGWTLCEHVPTRQRNASFAREPLDELPRDDLLDGARRAFQLDAVRALEQREHFLAARIQQFGDFVNTDGGQIVPLALFLRLSLALDKVVLGRV
jgi:hypothetical protein